MDMQAQSVRDRFGRYGPLIMWMLLISFASTNEFSALNTSKVIRPLLIWLYPQISEEGIRLAHFITRKLAHFAEYSILGFLAARAFFFSSRRLLQQLWFGAAMLLIMLYALIDEYHQSFVPSRSASLVDSAIDIAGGVTALAVFACLHRRSDASST
jgi:VanZ family protein